MTQHPLKFNLFTFGDSADINTFSNLPYFFTESLKSKGIHVNRINLLPEEDLFFKWYFNICRKWFFFNKRLLKRDVSFDLYRNKAIKFFVDRKIISKLKTYAQVNLNIFLTYSFSSYRFSKVPVVHYCDQTYELFLNDTRKKIRKRDKYFIKLEKKNLENAAHIFSTNSKCTKHITECYKLRNTTHLKGGINLDTSVIENEHQIINLKKNNKDILFIGRGIHKRGVDILVDAFRQFNRLNANAYTLHLVGISAKRITNADSSIKFYQYLDKNIPGELKLYLDLLKRARLFVMPMRTRTAARRRERSGVHVHACYHNQHLAYG